MKAIVFTRGRLPASLVLREVEKPAPAAGEVLVRIHNVSVNAADYRSMSLGIIPPHRIFGADISGVIEEVGEGVTGFRSGDEVFGEFGGGRFGGFAQYMTAPEKLLAHKPARVSFEDAAALPMAAFTALQALREKGNVQPGQSVLIYGAGGGVGTYAVQLARYYGAQVTAVCGPRNLEIVRSLGAQEVIDYTKQDVFSENRRFDLILAVNGSRPLTVYRRALKPGGVYVMVGGSLTQIFSSMIFGPLLSIGGRKMTYLSAEPRIEDLQFLIKLVEEGKLKPVIDRRFTLAETPDAVHYLSQGHARGKVVISVLPNN